ncbi:enoyl-CoA hydratase/isomerase family protein [Noviherbaspirillum pedocola]|uniref:Enoyl-CoA hydratase/isomerase family protein n=1 Tax=Noviherbaspirillum pedocola TaxID=2801341 RepID=A0A934W563_9BURK|nr:enoyl-CoA hydratase/isomerase family protein [Noviherbaspirillum pedocola]MBK4739286.1 enoyl-CoA hydratase/isomerase family protein [Noviherbaspirillum pedocola]
MTITGTGDKTFSFGYTLGAIRDQLDCRFEDMLDHIERFPFPTLCALNGRVYDDATDLAMCCDFRIGVRGSRFPMPAGRIGLHYYPGGMRHYITLLGLAASKKPFLIAQAIGDEEMLRNGFLHELVARDQLDATVPAYIKSILACEPKVLATMKVDLMAKTATMAHEEVPRGHYEQSLRSSELAARLDAIGQRPR